MFNNILKKLILVVISCILTSSIAFSDTNKINIINVEGNQRIDVETVISYSNIKIGDFYTEEAGNIILKKLFETANSYDGVRNQACTTPHVLQ